MNTIPTVVKAQGLCNRIKTYMSLLCEYGRVNTQVYADSYIFPQIQYHENPVNEVCGWRLKVLPEEEKYIKNYKTIDFLYEKTPKYFIEKYLKSLDKIKINSDILEYVDDFVKNWDDDVIGVHIRTWHSDGPRMLWHDNSIFEVEIDKFPIDKKIFLCSDNPETIKYFLEKYSERIILHPQKLHDTFLGQIHPYDQYHNNIQLITDGFIDCLLLSKCKTIIGTWASTFTEVAWWLGRCESTVIIPKPKNVTQKDENDFFTLK
jgi:hypothetical protein